MAIPAEAQQVLDSLPPLAAIAMGALAVVGLVLWLLGRSLAKPACAVSGLVLGGLAGYVVGALLSSEGAMTLPLVLGGAIAGGLLAVLLFRIWMGVTAAAILGLAVPAAVIIWQGTPITVHVTRADPTDADRTPVEADRPREKAEAAEAGAAGEAMPPMSIEIELPSWSMPGEDADTAEATRRPRARGDARRGVVDEAAEADEAGPLRAVGRVVQTTYDRQAAAIGAWWEGLGSSARWLLVAAALIGGGVGLVLGLSLPNMAASLQTALAGSLLLFFPLRVLAEGYAPGMAGVLPTSPRATLVTLGLITLLGVLVQWALFQRRADR